MCSPALEVALWRTDRGALRNVGRTVRGLFGGAEDPLVDSSASDCCAGTWAKSAYRENRLEDGDVQDALDAALAVGDLDTSNPSLHGTPEQRAGAWNTGFQSGDPSSGSTYLDPATLGDTSVGAP
jgi:hypothetical protein